MRGTPARMHDAFGNALMIEMGDLLAKNEIFQQGGTAWRGAQRILVIRNRYPLVGGEGRMILIGLLV
jgi:hypothetical protein